MSVCNNNTSDLISISFNVGKIRNYDINTGHICIRECKTAVKNKHII